MRANRLPLLVALEVSYQNSFRIASSILNANITQTNSNAVMKSQMTNQQVNDGNKIPTSALIYSMQSILSGKSDKIQYLTRYMETASMTIGSSETVMPYNEPIIPFDCYCIANYHVCLKSTNANASVYYMVGGAYLQGQMTWDGTKNPQVDLDRTFIFTATKGQNIQLKMKAQNGSTVTCLGANTSLTRYSFLFIPK